MKTRIISGVIMGVIVVAVLAAGFFINPFIITVAIALLAGGAIYELLHNAAGIKSKLAVWGAVIYAFLFIILNDTAVIGKYLFISSFNIFDYTVKGLTLLYFLFAVIMILVKNKEFDLSKMVSLFGIPFPYACAFLYLSGVIDGPNSIYYLLLLFNFSSVCDTGAYFVGVTMGKHKLCPVLSPKKTVEGAIGGILSSVIVTVILSLCFGKSILIPVILTVPFCVLGMIGDLFASAIKRAVGIKDYGNLIPGHGGILDRVDSIVMIAPFLYFAISSIGAI